MAPDDDDDPTGIRRLLSEMSDPRPMSSDLLSRITESLENERSTGQDGRPHEFDRAFEPPARGRRRLVLAGGGLGLSALAAVLLIQNLGSGPISGPDVQAVLRDDPSTASRVSVESPGRRASAPRLTVVATGTPYRRGRLGEQVHELVRVASVSRPATVGPSRDTLIDCLDDLSMRTTEAMVDVATFDGHDALVLVDVTSPGSSTVTVVPSTCGTHPVRPVAGPLHVR